MFVSGFNADNVRKGRGILKDGGTLGRVIEGFLETLTGIFLGLGKDFIHDLDLGGDEEGFVFVVGVAHTKDIMPILSDFSRKKINYFQRGNNVHTYALGVKGAFAPIPHR
jgi:hypothetical protein